MTAAFIAATMVLALGQSAPRDITLHGCVTPAQDPGTYFLSSVTHVTDPNGGQIPEMAHGRRVFFWLDNDEDVRKNMGRMVEVRGRFSAIEESEAELKAGRHKDGGLIVEFEGPGKDVRAPDGAAGVSVGTAGRVTPERNDVKTYLMRVDVKSVKATGSCQ